MVFCAHALFLLTHVILLFDENTLPGSKKILEIIFLIYNNLTDFTTPGPFVSINKMKKKWDSFFVIFNYIK